MKQRVRRAADRVLPRAVVKQLEAIYQKGRGAAIGARFGNPSRHMRVIVVAGSHGKATTACFINEILKEARFKTGLLSRSIEEVDLKLTVRPSRQRPFSAVRVQRFLKRAKQSGADFVVIEADYRVLGRRLLSGVPIEAVVMTNLTDDSLDDQASMDEYAAVFGRLFQMKPRFMVLNRDDEWFDYFNQFAAEGQKMTYGTHEEAEAKITRVKLFRKGTEVDVVLDHQTHLELATNLPGEFNALNLTAATTLAYLLGVKLQDIQEGAANLELLDGRFERVVDGLGYDVVVDYASTPSALNKLLTTAKDITRGRVILVFGARGDQDKAKRSIMGEIAGQKADRIFLTDEEYNSEDPADIRDMVREGIEKVGGGAKMTELPDRHEAIERALGSAKKGDIVLITGLGGKQYRHLGGEQQPWSDGAAVKEIVGHQGAA